MPESGEVRSAEVFVPILPCSHYTYCEAVWELFEQVEKGHLRPLPKIRHQMKQRLSGTVMRNSYVTLFKHHYCVPKDYVGKRMNIVFDADTVEIFHVPKLVTAHLRDDTPYEYTQKEAHHLPGHHGSYEKDMEEIYGRAGISSEASHTLPQHKNIRGRDYYSTTSTTSNK